MLAFGQMTNIPALERFLWAITVLLAAALAAVVLWRKNYKAYPLFFTYVLALLMQAVVASESYRLWGYGSLIAYKVGWGTQIVVIMARALAVVEICRRILTAYPGIWALSQRIFLAMAALVLVYSWAVGGHSWQVAAITLDRGLELAMATSLLGLFFLIGYYQVPVEPTDRLLAIGFFLYSCVVVLNDTIAERWLTRYTTRWNLVETASFVVSLVLWNWALHRTQPRTAVESELPPENLYHLMSPAINARLKALNEQLSHFWHTEGEKT